MGRKFHPKYRFKQLSLFTDRLCSAYLVAPDSPQKEFYRIWIERNDFIYKVCKESAAKVRVLDKRSWSFENSMRSKSCTTGASNPKPIRDHYSIMDTNTDFLSPAKQTEYQKIRFLWEMEKHIPHKPLAVVL